MPRTATVRNLENLLPAVRAHRTADGWRILHEFAQLLALDNQTRDLPALRRNSDAIVALFRERGATLDIVEHEGTAPILVGGLPAARPDAPTLGVYVHYDGQPANESEWRTAPFDPQLRTHPGGEPVPFPGAGEPIDEEWRLYARAAADDKAPLIAILSALDALRAIGVPPAVNLVFCFEGEEESGSPHLRDYLDTLRDRLRADAWLICDGPVHQTGAAQVVLGVRGFCSFELTVYGPERELHSGHYGNWAPNPAIELCQVLASVKDGTGTVTIPGFYDRTRRPSEAENAVLAALPAMEQALLDDLGLAAAEVPRSRLVDRLMIPSLNVRGLAAGAVGAGARNVIPATATASVDIRLAAGDDPARMLALVREHLTGLGYHVLDREPTPEERRRYRRLARLDGEVGYPAARTPVETPVVKRLLDAATEASGRPALVMPTLGGSVPLHHFAEVLDAPTVIMPIANSDNNQHAANENLRLGNLWYAIDLFSLLFTADALT